MSDIEYFHSDLSPAWQFLLTCTRMDLAHAEGARRAYSLLDAAIAWEPTAAMACHHGIAPLVYHHVRRLGVAELLPPAALTILKDFSYRNAVRNTILYKELQRLLLALQESEIPVIALKGAALAEPVYHNRALRPMNDVDLLVHKSHLSRIEKTLATLHYRLDDSRHTKEWYQEHHYHVVFRKQGVTPTDLHFEVHWHLERPTRPFAIDLDGLWERAVTATIADVKTLVLAPEDLLLHLCLHLCHHQFTFGLRPFCDIAATIRQYGHTMDWEQVHRRAWQWRINQYVYLTLSLARDLLGAAVPEAVCEALRPANFDPRLLGWAGAKILALSGTAPISHNFARFWEGRRLKEKMTSVLATFAPEAIAQNYPVSPTSRRVYLYYPARLRDLVLQYGPTLGRLCGRNQHWRAVVEREYHIAQLDAWLATEWGEP